MEKIMHKICQNAMLPHSDATYALYMPTECFFFILLYDL